MIFSVVGPNTTTPSLPVDWRTQCLREALGSPYAPSPSSLASDFDEAIKQVPSPCFSSIIIASSNSIVLGFLILKVTFSDADIDYVVAFRPRQGVALRLLQTAETFAAQRQITRLVLEVGEKNGPARALYEKGGYLQIAVRKKYYAGVEDALILEKMLPEPV